MPPDPRRPVYHGLRESPSGTELVIAFYTRGCLYGACSFCSLPALSAGALNIGDEDIRAQADFALASLAGRDLARVRRVSVYNSGSVLDQRTLPTPALFHLIEKVAAMPELALVSLDTRAEFVEPQELDGLKARLGRAALELSIGYEARDARMRNRILRKGLSERAFQDLCALLASKGVRLKAYVMVKPDVALSDARAALEAVRTLDHLAATGKRLGLSISAHLNPAYVARGSRLEKEFREQGYVPPRLWTVVDSILPCENLGLPIQVGLDTEGLAVKGGTFHNCGRCDARVRKALEAFSATQDYGPLKELSCPCR